MSHQYDKNMTNKIGSRFTCGYVTIMNDAEENWTAVETQKGLHQSWWPAGRQRVTLVRAQGSSLVRRVERPTTTQQTCICSWIGSGYYLHLTQKTLSCYYAVLG